LGIFLPHEEKKSKKVFNTADLWNSDTDHRMEKFYIYKDFDHYAGLHIHIANSLR